MRDSKTRFSPPFAARSRWALVLLVAAGALAALSALVGCARDGVWPGGALTPRAEVAACGGFEPGVWLPLGVEASPPATLAQSSLATADPSGADPLALPTKSAPETVEPPRLALELRAIEVDGAPHLEVELRGGVAVDLKVTPLSVGEALLYSQGGVLKTSAQTVHLSAEPAGVSASTRVDLTQLKQAPSGLLAVDALAIAPDGVRLERHELVQYGPLRLDVAPDVGQVTLAVSGADGAPVPGAWVELLDADGRVLSGGATDAEGGLALGWPGVRQRPLLGDDLFIIARDGAHAVLSRLTPDRLAAP